MAKAQAEDKKKVAKVAKAAPAVKVTYSATELRGKEVKVLLDDLVTVKADLADARRSLAAGELVNPNVINKYRKAIARIQTVIVQKARVDQGKEDA